jgi:hypothetical protein
MSTEQETREVSEVIVEDLTPVAGPPVENSEPAEPEESGVGPVTDSQWQRIQASFIDDPRASVMAAADLVEKIADSLVATIRERERVLRGGWEGDSASTDTEKLRTTLRDYRSFYKEISQI